MQTRRSHMTNLAAISILLLGGAATLLTEPLRAVRAFQEQQLRILKRLPFSRSEPIVITGVKVNGQAVLFDQNFAADDDWIKTLVVSVKNRSDKRILYFSTDLFLPPVPGTQSQASVFNLSYGNYGLLWGHAPSPAERLVGLAPGESIDIGLTGRQLENFRKFFEAIGRPKLEKVSLQFSQILFEDDTMWSLQGPFIRDPKDSGKWIASPPSTENKKQHHLTLKIKGQESFNGGY